MVEAGVECLLEDRQVRRCMMGSVTLGYTSGYLPIGSGPIRLCTCGVQVPMGRREIVVFGLMYLTMLRVFMS